MTTRPSSQLTAMLRGIVLVPAMFVIASLASAQPPEGQPPSDGDSRGERRGPPVESIEACNRLSEGDSCSFEGRRGEALTGQCFMPPHDQATLACKPEGHGMRKQDGDDNRP